MIGDGGHRDDDDPAREGGGDALRYRQRETRLADAAVSGQRRKTRFKVRDEFDERVELRLTPHQRSAWNGHDAVGRG